MEKTKILEMRGINKSFPGVKALSNMNLTLRSGEIHALMGENGAGKSTLVKVLTGVHEADSGEITLNGKKVSPKSPLDAQNLGISTVYQEVNLCANLTVAENIFLGRQPKKSGGIDWKSMNSRAEEVLKRLNITIDVTQILSSYSVAIQQMIAIARAVDISSGVLVLDEPTSSLDSNEVKELFKVMLKLKNEGMGIIFITHFLDQVYEVSDTITVLRNGKLVGEYESKNLSRLDLVSKMIGKDLEALEHMPKENKTFSEDENLVLSAKGLGKKGTINPFNIDIRKGEIIGLGGLLGSGRSEIARILFGIDKNDEGVLYLDNKMFNSMYPKKAIDEGMAFCPEERKVEGIVGELTIRENMMLALQASKGMFDYIPMKTQVEIAEKYIKLLNVATPSMEQRIDKLSGGNQQKVILGRWLATHPKLIILDEPTRGIDVGSKLEIQKLILKLAGEGMSIVFISSELEELVRCCDRVMVLRDRSQIGMLTGDNIKESAIITTIAGGEK